MSDFTKEELKLMKEAMYLLDTYLRGRDQEAGYLLIKIQAMIDNLNKHD